MHKIIYRYLLGLALCTSSLAFPAESVNISDKSIDYKAEGDRFVIVSVQKPGMSKEDTKKAALKRAADITLENGYSSFSIESESEVTVFQSKPNYPSNSDFPGNLYEEEIVEDNFNRDRIITQDEYGTRPSPAMQIVIECSKGSPEGDRLNPCDYTTCK